MNAVDEFLIMEAKNGNEDSLTKIVNEYSHLIKMCANKYFISGGDFEDIVQEGTIGLVKAIKGYRLDRETSFKTFAHLCITRQIITAIKKANSQKNQILNKSIKMSQEGERVAGRFRTYSPEEICISLEKERGLKRYLETHLSRLEQQVFNLMLVGYSYREIAEKKKMDPKVVDNAIQRVKKKAGTWLENH